MKIGMTGTRDGASPGQLAQFRFDLIDLRATELHHGDCVGADAQCHAIAVELGIRIVIHPPLVVVYRAWMKGDEHRPELDYLTRNRNIVDETDFLIALPDGPERARSGTWSTFRYAQRSAKPNAVYLP